VELSAATAFHLPADGAGGRGGHARLRESAPCIRLSLAGSAQSVADRIQDSEARFVITADGGFRHGSVVPLKQTWTALTLRTRKGGCLQKQSKKYFAPRAEMKFSFSKAGMFGGDEVRSERRIRRRWITKRPFYPLTVVRPGKRAHHGRVYVYQYGRATCST
jgi:hypothetical protein